MSNEGAKRKQLFSIVLVNLDDPEKSYIYPNIHKRLYQIRFELVDAQENNRTAEFREMDRIIRIPYSLLGNHIIVIARQWEET